MFTVIVITISVLVFVAILVLFNSTDRVEKLKDTLALQKAALLYGADYRKIVSTFLSARRSVFSIMEPVVWVYKQEGQEDILLGNFRKHLRVWVQPESKLDNVHIVLDAMRNNLFFTNLLRFKLPRRSIRLEGDFPSYFRVYCKPGQEIITLQIIAPDVMAFIIDNAMEVDVEIIDQQIAIIYKNGAQSDTTIQMGIELMAKMSKLQRAAKKVTSL